MIHPPFGRVGGGVRQVDLMGAAHLKLVSGVVHLHPQDAMVRCGGS